MAQEPKKSIKYDEEKPKLGLIYPDFLVDLSIILENGEKEYGVKNWQGLKFSRIIDAIKRHTLAIEEGEDIDKESGKTHAAHIASNTMFLHWWHKYGHDNQDDRPWKSKLPCPSPDERYRCPSGH